MFKTIDGPKVLKASRRLVEEFVSMEPCPGDRNVKPAILSKLSKELRDGNLRSPEWASAVCKEDGKTYRVNGKHTSQVLAAMNGTLPDVLVFVTRFECETLRDLAELYATFDSRVSVRSTGDVCKAHQMSHGALSELSSRLVSLCVSGLAYSKWEDAAFSGQHPIDERAQLMFENVDFIFWVKQIGVESVREYQHLRRSPVIAAMKRTYDKSQSASQKFWAAVAAGTGHPNSVPDRRLAQYLTLTAVNNGMGSVRKKDKATPLEMYVTCLRYWNLWRKNPNDDLKLNTSTKIPPVI